MGYREVTIRLLGGTSCKVLASYYHRKSINDKNKRKCGMYPGLTLIGISNHYTPSLEYRLSKFATALGSYSEVTELVEETFGFKITAKTIVSMVKRLAEKVRAAISMDKFKQPDDFSGKIVAASMDGGRVRIRKNKRGKKTKKNRTRYHTDWKEPKLLIIYVVGEDGKRERSVLPIIDTMVGKADQIFSLLIFYLKQLKVRNADMLIFLSDGAKWIWDRVKTIASKVGIEVNKCLFVLDYYHAVEHLTEITLHKRWSSREKKKWVRLQKKYLMEGNLDKFMNNIDKACKGTKNAILKRERKYFENHIQHMDYTTLKSKGFPIGSGAVESGIRRVVNLRLKGAGIFWHEDSANAMLLLRSYYKAGRWNLLKSIACKGDLLAL